MNETAIGDVLPAAVLGEAWALRALYEHLAPQVFGYLRAHGASEPEDLTSEVFLAVFPRLATVTGGPAGLRTFVFSVAHARLVDDFRRRARRPDPIEYEPQRDPRTVASAETEALDSIATEEVHAMLAGLPKDQRDVIVLRVVADLTVGQVAEILGRTVGAIKQLQRRGLLTLKRQFGADVTI